MNSTAEPRNHRLLIALIPFWLAGIVVVVATGAIFLTGWSSNVGSIVFGIAGAVLIFDVPVCVLVLIDWLLTGKPPMLHLSPLIPCREERELHRLLRERPKLSDDEFYQEFFAGSEIPYHVPVQLREIMERATGVDMRGVHPDDNLAWVDTELDFADILYRIDCELGVTIPPDSLALEECRFGSLVERIAKAAKAKLAPDSSGPK